MSTLREQVLRKHISSYYPNAHITSWNDPDSGLSFYTAQQLQELDADWFPLSAQLDPDSCKVIYGGRPRIIHTYTGGETGAGKTTRFAMQSIRALSSMKGKPSFLVMDIHGELVENLYAHLKENGYDIRILNCDDPSHSDTYNPFATMARRCAESRELDYQTVNDIRKIADLVQPLAASDDPVWYEGARSYTNGAILDKFEDLVRGQIAPENITLYNIIENHYWLRQKLMDTRPSVNSTCDLLRIPHYQNKGPQALSVQKMMAVTNNAEKTMKSYFGVIENRYDAFGQPSLYQLSSSSTIDIQRFIEIPTAIFIQAGSTTIGDDLLSLMVNDIYNTVVHLGKQSTTKLLPRKIHCFLDEFANSHIAEGPEFIRMLTTSRKFGMYWHMLLQCDAQLERKFDANMGRIIRANCTELFMGSHDYETTLRFARSCGQKTVESLSSQLAQQDPVLNVVDLITPEQLTLLEEGHLYIRTNRSPLMHSYIEAFYRCPEFTRLENIRSAYPENTFRYQDTLFTPDDIKPSLSEEEFLILRYVFENENVSVDDLPFVIDRDAPTTDHLLHEMDKKHLVQVDEDWEYVSNTMSLQDYQTLKKQFPDLPYSPILSALSPMEFQVMSYIHRRKRVNTSTMKSDFTEVTLSPITDKLEKLRLIKFNPGKLTVVTAIDDWQFERLASNCNVDLASSTEDSLLLQFKEAIKRAPGYPNLDLKILRSLSCVPDSIFFYLRCAMDKVQYDPTQAVVQLNILRFEIIEAYIGNNDFPTKPEWDRGLARELSIIKSLEYLPKEVKDCFQKAYTELSQNLTLTNIQEIRKIITG